MRFVKPMKVQFSMAEWVEILFFLFGIAAPLFFAVYILRHFDYAAKRRRAEVRIFIVDFFSLIFMVQIPLVVLRNQIDLREFIFFCVTFVLVMILIWWTTVRTVAQAGIQTTGWRTLISIIVIPSTYVGAFGIPSCVAVFTAANEATARWALGIGIFLVFAMTVSLFITKAAMKAIDDQPIGSDLEDETFSPIDRE